MADSAFQIRVATPADIPALAVFAAHHFSQTFTHYTAEDLRAHLEKTCSETYFTAALNDSALIFIAEADGQWIGYCMLGAVMVPVDGPAHACELYRLYVDPHYHGKKIGHALMDAALGTPLALAAPAVYLSVWSENAKAQRFYAKYGFVPVGEYLYPVGAHFDQEIILCKMQ